MLTVGAYLWAERNPIMKNPRKTRRASLAVLAGLAVTGIVGASAATLGGLGVSSLGADDEAVASCNADGVDIDFRIDYDGTTPIVDQVVVSDVDTDCDGKDFELTLFDDSDVVLTTQTGTIDLDDGASFNVDGDDLAAEDVYHVSLVISG